MPPEDAPTTLRPFAHQDASRFWALDPEVIFLNHGSFGACPRAVLDAQQHLRERMEAEPVRFLFMGFEASWDEARRELAEYVGAEAEDLVFVPNATAGINAVLRSLPFRPGDELLVTDQEYNASRNVLDFAALRGGARVIVAPVPFPIRSEEEVFDAVLDQVTPRTRLCLLDFVTSQTAVVFPVERLVRELSRRGVETLLDAAHAPGMVSLNLSGLGAAYTTGNGHKWLCAPKGAAFLHVRRDLQHAIRPALISHGANSKRADRSRFLLEFGWTGTDDPTPFLCLPEAIRFMASLCPGGWPEVMARNRSLALQARDLLCQTLGLGAPCPDSMIGSMAALPLPPSPGPAPAPPLFLDPLQVALWERYRIEIPVIHWPAFPHRLLRLSAQLYNAPAQYETLASALETLLRAGF